MIRKFLGAPLVGLLLLAGCTYTVQRDGDDQFLQQEIDWKVGETTLTEVTEQIGPPDDIRTWGDRLWFLYTFEEVRTSGFKLSYQLVLFKLANVEKTDSDLIVAFDEDDKLAYYGMNGGPFGSRGTVPADEEPRPAEQEARWLRLSIRNGPGYFRYREGISGVLDTDYVATAYTVSVSAEAFVGDLAPFLHATAGYADGNEVAEQAGIRSDRSMTTNWALVDAGLGYQINLDRGLYITPTLGYSLNLASFHRYNIRENGFRVAIPSLDGKLLLSVDEDFTGHGLSAGFGIRNEVSDTLSAAFRAAYTYFPSTRVDNEFGGTVYSKGGFMLRGAFTTSWWLHPNIAVDFGAEASYVELQNSDIELETGTASSALVQFPDSSMLAAELTLGLRARF